MHEVEMLYVRARNIDICISGGSASHDLIEAGY